MRPTAYMLQCLLLSYINPAYQAHMVQTGNVPGINSSHWLMLEKLKESYSLYPRGPQIVYI